MHTRLKTKSLWALLSAITLPTLTLAKDPRADQCPRFQQIIYKNTRDFLPSAVVLSGSYACYKKPRLACGALGASIAWYAYAAREPKPLKWRWYQLEQDGALQVQNLRFPENFLWGVGTSAQQVEGGCTHNSWSEWEKKHVEAKTRKSDGSLLVEEYAGNACNQWDHHQIDTDIKCLQELGVNAYRFSIEWSKIEPQEGIIDRQAIDHYDLLCKKLVAAGIRPVITLHHYTDPIWFMNKGGFATLENIQLYTKFCCTMFATLNKYKPLWFTFNSPAAYAINSYSEGVRPPGKRSLQTAMEVLNTMLHAHVAAYHAMKTLDPSCEVGIMHNIFHLDLGSRFNPLDHLARNIGNSLTNTNVFNFFTTGNFKVWVPGRANVQSYTPEAVGALDCIGLNYYSHAYISQFKPMPASDEIPTDNPRYTIYAEGLYRAVQELNKSVTKPLETTHTKKISIYVTENGIATTDDDTRTLFLKRTLYALSRASTDFDNVKGYIHWSFIDNYEWGTYSKKYGVYAVDFTNQQRTLKPGSQFFKDVIAHHSA